MKENKKGISVTWFAFKVFKKFPRLFTIPCQWAIKACCAAVFATERTPFTKLALDILGACAMFQIESYLSNSRQVIKIYPQKHNGFKY